jgi:hypothetical protein
MDSNSTVKTVLRTFSPLLGLLLGFFSQTAHAVLVTPGDILVSVNEFTGSSSAPRWIREYSATGVRVQTLSQVPNPGGPGFSTDTARDLLFRPDGTVYLYNGTFTPTLSRFDPATSTWTQTTAPGWSTVNVLEFGGIAQLGQQIFVTDMETFNTGGTPKGIVRFDLGTGTNSRFASTISPLDLSVGPGGVLYALDGAGSPRGTVYKFDSTTGLALGTVAVPTADYRGIAVAADGSFFLADYSGVISRFSSAGSLLDSLTVPGEALGDISLDSLGRIAIGTASSGNVIVTDMLLDSFTKFRATDSALGGSTFVAWTTPVPEPATAIVGLALMAVGVASRRRTKVRA